MENNLLLQVNQTRHQLERTQRSVDSLGTEVNRTTVLAERLEQYVAQLRERLPKITGLTNQRSLR